MADLGLAADRPPGPTTCRSASTSARTCRGGDRWAAGCRPDSSSGPVGDAGLRRPRDGPGHRPGAAGADRATGRPLHSTPPTATAPVPRLTTVRAGAVGVGGFVAAPVLGIDMPVLLGTLAAIAAGHPDVGVLFAALPLALMAAPNGPAERRRSWWRPPPQTVDSVVVQPASTPGRSPRGCSPPRSIVGFGLYGVTGLFLGLVAGRWCWRRCSGSTRTDQVPAGRGPADRCRCRRCAQGRVGTRSPHQPGRDAVDHRRRRDRTRRRRGATEPVLDPVGPRLGDHMTPSPAEADATAPTANQNGLVAAAATADAAVPDRGRRPGGRGVVALRVAPTRRPTTTRRSSRAADHDPDPTHVSQTFAALGCASATPAGRPPSDRCGGSTQPTRGSPSGFRRVTGAAGPGRCTHPEVDALADVVDVAVEHLGHDELPGPSSKVPLRRGMLSSSLSSPSTTARRTSARSMPSSSAAPSRARTDTRWSAPAPETRRPGGPPGAAPAPPRPGRGRGRRSTHPTWGPRRGRRSTRGLLSGRAEDILTAYGPTATAPVAHPRPPAIPFSPGGTSVRPDLATGTEWG